MKAILFLLFAAIASAAGVETSITGDFVTAYVFRGKPLFGPSMQGSVNASMGGGYLNAWTSPTVNETDFAAGYSTNGFDVGANLYTYQAGGDTWEPYAGYSYGERSTISVYAYYDVKLHVFTAEGKASVQLAEFKSLTLSADALAGWSDYAYWGAGPTLKWSAGKFSLSASAQYVRPFNSIVGKLSANLSF